MGKDFADLDLVHHMMRSRTYYLFGVIPIWSSEDDVSLHEDKDWAKLQKDSQEELE